MSTQNNPSQPWTVLRLLEWTESFFAQKGIEDPRLNAQLLLGKALGMERIMLYARFDHVPTQQELTTFRQFVKRRAAREPTQYIVGTREFYGRPFHVEPGVLIPRPETELLVRKTLELLPQEEELNVLDLATGSGCIAVTLAAERPNWTLWATDSSAEAVRIAQKNARSLQLDNRVQLLQGCLFEPLEQAPLEPGSLAAIVSNPPYIPSGQVDTLDPEVREHEPRQALDGGADGLLYFRRIVPGAARWLRPGGWLLLELDPEQVEPLREIFAECRDFLGPEFFKDLSDNWRAVAAKRRP